MSYRRNNTNPTYDHALLSSVPDPTRAERQEGYNVDLLDEGHDRPAATDQRPLTDGYSPFVTAAHKEGQAENGTNGMRPAVANVPWYRTKWGVTVIVVAIVIIVGGIVGGVVGGTHHSHKNNSGSLSGSAIPNGSGNGAGSPTSAGKPSSSSGIPGGGNESIAPQGTVPPSQTSGATSSPTSSSTNNSQQTTLQATQQTTPQTTPGPGIATVVPSTRG
jgi:hypothetical protein